MNATVYAYHVYLHLRQATSTSRVSFQHLRIETMYGRKLKQRLRYDDAAGAGAVVVGGGAVVPSAAGGAVSPFSGFGEIGILATGVGGACVIGFLPLAL